MKKNRIRIGLLALALAVSFAAAASADKGSERLANFIVNEAFGAQRNDNGCPPRDFNEIDLAFQPVVDPITGNPVRIIEGTFRAFNTNGTPDGGVRGRLEVFSMDLSRPQILDRIDRMVLRTNAKGVEFFTSILPQDLLDGTTPLPDFFVVNLDPLNRRGNTGQIDLQVFQRFDSLDQ